MSDKETVLTQLQNHQCSVQDAMLALDYIYAEKARPLLDACGYVTGQLECICSEEPGHECSICTCQKAIEQYKKGI